MIPTSLLFLHQRIKYVIDAWVMRARSRVQARHQEVADLEEERKIAEITGQYETKNELDTSSTTHEDMKLPKWEYLKDLKRRRLEQQAKMDSNGALS